MMQTSPPHAKRLFIGGLLALLFLIPLFAACGNGSRSTGITPTPQRTAAKVGTGSATPDGTPGTVFGPQACPAGSADLAHWQAIINPYAYGGQQHVESVSCANLMDNPSLQALVTDRRLDTSNTLDVFMFTNITAATPTRVFQTYGLVKGDAKISDFSTVMTAQADQLSPLNTGKSVSAMTADLYREFKWSESARTLVQTAFPGIFPDLTRYQAEADQEQVNQGHQPWKLSATMVANALAVSLLDWSSSSPTTLLSGGGTHDDSAVVKVKSSAAGSGAIEVTLSRLKGNTNGGIWEAVAVAVDGMSITSPGPLAQFSSPVRVKGTGNAFEGQIGQLIVLDHLYHKIGQANATGTVGEGQTSFSTSVYFQSTFPAGIQEGVLVLSAPSNANGSIAAAVLIKVLVNGALQRTFQVLSIEVGVHPASIAGIACGSQITVTYTATFYVPEGTAGGTIQFLYTWNNGRASPGASITVAPGATTAIYSFTWSGELPTDHTYPGMGGVITSSPNAVTSLMVKPAGMCS